MAIATNCRSSKHLSGGGVFDDNCHQPASMTVDPSTTLVVVVFCMTCAIFKEEKIDAEVAKDENSFSLVCGSTKRCFSVN